MGVYLYGLENKTQARKHTVLGEAGVKIRRNALIACFVFITKVHWGLVGGDDTKEFEKYDKKFRRSWGKEPPTYVIFDKFLCVVNKRNWRKRVENGETFRCLELRPPKDWFGDTSTESDAPFTIVGFVKEKKEEKNKFSLLSFCYCESLEEAEKAYSKWQDKEIAKRNEEITRLEKLNA